MTEGPLSGISRHQATWMIRGAFFAAMVALGFTLWAMAMRVLGASAWNLLDAAIILGLAIGMLRRSYLCAWLLFGYHVANRVYYYYATGRVPGRLAYSLGLLYFLGIVGVTVLGPRERTVRENASASLPPGESL